MHTHRAFNIPIERIGKWKESAELFGVELGSLVSLWQRVESAQRDALENPESAAGKAFSALGIKKDDIAGLTGDQMAELLLKTYRDRGKNTKDIPLLREAGGGRNVTEYTPMADVLPSEQQAAFSKETVTNITKAQRTWKVFWMDFYNTIVEYTAKNSNLRPWVRKRFGIAEVPDILSDQSKKQTEDRKAAETKAQNLEAYRKEMLDKYWKTYVPNQLKQQDESEQKQLARGGILANILNARNQSSYNEQGIFLRGTPRGLTDSIPRQQLKVQTDIYNALQNVALGNGF